jgi:hypothetical protein
VNHDHYPDLLALLGEARRLAPDDRYIWCAAADTFESRLQQRRGMLLGGAYSPQFLRDTSAQTWDVPWVVRLRYGRVAVCGKAAQEPLAAWLPLMEQIASANESLLVVADAVESELLATFLVNAFKGTLRVCVAHHLDQENPSRSGAQLSAPPATSDQLLRIDDIRVRRTATACFPAATDPLATAPNLQNFVIIETGGENHDDQYDRLRFLMRELQRT